MRRLSHCSMLNCQLSFKYGEGGIRPLARLYGSLSYTIRIAKFAKFAMTPGDPCTLLHAAAKAAVQQTIFSALGLLVPFRT